MAVLATLAAPATALDLPLPTGAVETARDGAAYGSVRIPTGPWDGTAVPADEVEGNVLRRAWRASSSGLTPLQVLAPIRAALAEQGYALGYECADAECGGFDFRYALKLLSEPEMHVDLGNFRVLSASRETPRGPEHLLLLASRSANAAYLHLTRVTPGAVPTPRGISLGDPAPPAPAATQSPPAAEASLADLLRTEGHAVLTDLSFGSGAATLEAEDLASLAELAAFMAANPSAGLVLVGHTDDRGDPAANVSLSKRRAEAVAKALVAAHGLDPARVRADGVGFLAPIASNATEEGRQRNRRVEAVITGLETSEAD